MAKARSEGIVKESAKRSAVAARVVLPIHRYLHLQAASGACLVAAAVVALVLANSPWSDTYFDLRDLPITVSAGPATFELTLREWINDGLMVLFFLGIGLEIKREALFGELSQGRKATAPIAAAIGGMVVPAAIYAAFNWGGEGLRGWGIPMATDIAFALGVLALVGQRFPDEVRVLFLAIATVDDIGTILVIALFYSSELSYPALGGAALAVTAMLLLSRSGVRTGAAYALLGIALWVAIMLSGVHATIAGVLLGLCVPARGAYRRREVAQHGSKRLRELDHAERDADPESSEHALGRLEVMVTGTEPLLERWERNLQPWISYLVLPLFALANAGIAISLADLGAVFTNPVGQGIAAALAIGKPVGVILGTVVALRLAGGALPQGVAWPHVVAIALLAGIGFTVSLFVTELAFHKAELADAARVSILLVSTVAAVAGGAVVMVFARRGAPATGAGRTSKRKR